MKYWKHGMKQDFASTAGLSPQHLSDILAGRKRPNYDMAIRLENATILTPGLPTVPALSWLDPVRYPNPLTETPIEGDED